LKTWVLPLLAIALTVPIIAAFAFGGPPAGLAAGALMAAGVLIIAARLQPDELIEVASRRDDVYRVLIVATVAVENPSAVEAVMESVDAATASWETRDEATEVVMVAPAFNRLLAHWLSDVEAARLDAQRRLTISLAGLAAAGIAARGQVGDADAMQALEDALRTFAADEVQIVTGPPGVDRDGDLLVVEARRRLARPVRQLDGTEARPASASGREFTLGR
jgi:hypothetical protein